MVSKTASQPVETACADPSSPLTPPSDFYQLLNPFFLSSNRIVGYGQPQKATSLERLDRLDPQRHHPVQT